MHILSEVLRHYRASLRKIGRPATGVRKLHRGVSVCAQKKTPEFCVRTRTICRNMRPKTMPENRKLYTKACARPDIIAIRLDGGGRGCMGARWAWSLTKLGVTGTEFCDGSDCASPGRKQSVRCQRCSSLLRIPSAGGFSVSSSSSSKNHQTCPRRHQPKRQCVVTWARVVASFFVGGCAGEAGEHST